MQLLASFLPRSWHPSPLALSDLAPPGLSQVSLFDHHQSPYLLTRIIILHIGSLAASIQSGIGNVVAGSLFATSQSVAMGGAIPTVVSAMGAGVGTVVGAMARGDGDESDGEESDGNGSDGKGGDENESDRNESASDREGSNGGSSDAASGTTLVGTSVASASIGGTAIKKDKRKKKKKRVTTTAAAAAIAQAANPDPGMMTVK